MRQSYNGHFALSCLTYVLIPLQILQVDLEFDEGFLAGIKDQSQSGPGLNLHILSWFIEIS